MANELFKLNGTVYIDTSKADESLQKVDESTTSFGEKLATLGKTAGTVAVALGTAIASAGTAIYKVTTESASNLDAIQKGAQKMNLAYDSYQELSYVLERNGTSIDVLSKGITNITNDLADFSNGTASASESYDALGVSMTKVDGTMKSTEELLYDSIYALADMTDTTQRNALAQEIFGKSYTELIPTLNGGSEAIEELVGKANELGLVLSEDSIDAGASFCDQLDDVKDSLSAVVTQIGSELMPLISSALAWILDHMPEIQEFLGQFFDALQKFIEVTMKVIKAIAPVVQTVWDNLIKPILEGIVEFLDWTLGGGFERLYNNVVSTCNKVIQPFRNMVNSFKNAWSSLTSSLKMPHFSISGTFSLHPLSVPHLSIDWYDKAMDEGMIMNIPTIFGMNSQGQPMAGGESGSEAVVGTESLQEMVAKAVNESNNEQAKKMDELITLISAYLPTIASKELTISTSDIYNATNKRATQKSNATMMFKGSY